MVQRRVDNSTATQKRSKRYGRGSQRLGGRGFRRVEHCGCDTRSGKPRVHVGGAHNGNGEHMVESGVGAGVRRGCEGL